MDLDNRKEFLNVLAEIIDDHSTLCSTPADVQISVRDDAEADARGVTQAFVGLQELLHVVLIPVVEHLDDIDDDMLDEPTEDLVAHIRKKAEQMEHNDGQ